MSFSKRKSDRRKPDVRPLAASAEVCEARALLSADGAAVTVEEIVDTKSDDASTVDVENGDGEIVPEIAICMMLPLDGEFVSEGEVVEGEELLYTCGLPVDEQIRHALPVDEFIREDEFVSITSFEDWDPSWAYTSFLVDDAGAEVVDGDGEVIVGEEEFVDVTTLEDCDPWAYRSALPVYELAGEEEFVDVTMLDTTLEEWDPSWAYRGVVVEEEFSTTDDFETVTDDVTDEDVIFYTMGVLEKEVDGDVVVDDSEESAEATDGEEVVDEVQDSEELTESELHDLIRYNMAPNFRGNSGTDGIVASNAGGIMTESPEVTAAEVMGPVASGGPVSTSVSMPAVNVPVAVPVTSVVPVSASIPVSFSSFQPLFETRQEIDNIGTLIAQLPDDSSVSSELSEVAVSSGLESVLGQTQSDALDSLDSDLEVLDTILDGDAAESESEITSEPVDVEVAPEEPVTTAKETVPVTDTTVVASARPGRHSSDRLMDRFMTEFAVNGFAG